jgi:hypothetical protein
LQRLFDVFFVIVNGHDDGDELHDLPTLVTFWITQN